MVDEQSKKAESHGHGKSRYGAGFFLRLIILAALLGFAVYEGLNAQKANEKLDELVNVYPGSPIGDVEKLLGDMKPTATRTEKIEEDVNALEAEIKSLEEEIAKMDDGIDKDKKQRSLDLLRPRLANPVTEYQVDTYCFLKTPILNRNFQFVEVASKEVTSKDQESEKRRVVEKITTNKKFVLTSLKSGLKSELSGREEPLVAAAAGGGGGTPPPQNDDDEEDNENDEDSDDETSEDDESGESTDEDSSDEESNDG